MITNVIGAMLNHIQNNRQKLGYSWSSCSRSHYFSRKLLKVNRLPADFLVNLPDRANSSVVEYAPSRKKTIDHYAKDGVRDFYHDPLREMEDRPIKSFEISEA